MQIKAPVGKFFTPTTIAAIKKSRVGEEVEKLVPSYMAYGNEIVQLLWKTVCQVLKTLFMKVPFDLTCLLLGM